MSVNCPINKPIENMAKKYELTDETIEYNGHTLHRIKALVDISNTVKAGNLGGWIESEENLKHEGKCWVYDRAKVYGDAKVSGDAVVYGGAVVRDNAIVFGNAEVCDNAEVYGNANVRDNAKVYDDAEVYDYAEVSCNARVCDHAFVHGHAMVWGRAAVFGDAEVYDDARVFGNASVYEDAEVCGNVRVYGNAIVRDGKIQKTSDILVVGPLGSRVSDATLNVSSGTVCTGCFKGTIEEFEKAVKEKHGDNEYGKAYTLFITYIRAVLDNAQATNRQTQYDQEI